MSDRTSSDSTDGPDFAVSPAFADGKDTAAFRTIGEIAQAFGIKQHVLRYWEEQFPMLKPLKRAGGRRYYRPEDVRLIGEINRLLYAEGFTIRGAKQALGGEKGAAPAAAASATPERRDDISEAIPVATVSGDAAARLRRVRETLSRALELG